MNGYFVINDRKYVELVRKRMQLTDYTLSNMNKCCLAFNSSDSNDGKRLTFEFCKNCPSRKKIQTKHINDRNKHNERIFNRAQQCDIDRVVEDLTQDIQFRDNLLGSFGYKLKQLMDLNRFTNNSLYK